MMEKQLIPAGYKQTEVGVIPEDWDAIQVQDVCDFIVPGRNKPLKFDGDIPWITTPDLTDSRVVYSSRAGLKISKEEAKSVGSKIVPEGSVIMSCVGELGLVAIAGQNIVLNQQLHAFLPSGKINNYYLAYALKDQESYFYSAATKTALPYLNKDNCNATPLPLPPMQEQTAIANALSDVDALIAALEKLINKKSAIKTAAMQQLLTGKKRLPPFDQLNTGYKQTELGEIPGDWACVPSNIAINFFCGYGFSSRAATTTGIKWLKISNVGINEIKWDAESYLPATFIDEFKEFSLAPNDIVMALTRPILGDQLKIARINKSDVPVLLNQRVAKLEAKSFNGNDFLYYVVQRLNFVSAMNLAMAGSDPPNIGTASLGKIKIIIPNSRDEQTAIANLLSDMDKDLESLQQRLHKTQQIKQGMMQELLTGKTRLI